jgi:DNA polymerase-1
MAKSRKVLSQIMTLPLFKHDTSWRPPKEPPNLDGVKVLAVDCETHDPELGTMGPGFIRGAANTVGVAIATEDEQWYFPIGHAIENCSWEVEDWLKETLMHDRSYIFANAQYDIEALWSMGINVSGHWSDILVDQALIDEEFEPGYSLEAVAEHWLGEGKASDTLLKNASHFGAQTLEDAMKMMKYLPASEVGEYAEIDARRTYDTALAQEVYLQKNDLMEIINLERSILPLAWQMRRNGIRFNREKAVRLNAELYRDEEETLSKLIKSGFKIDPWSSKSIAAYCDRFKIIYIRTAKGNPSFSKEFFNLSNHKDPVMKLTGHYRSINKIRRDFIGSWLKFSEHDERIHSRWHQVSTDDGGTRSGRFASTTPNLQQVPARHPIHGPLLRSLFLPEENQQFLKGDYSGQEIRVAIHYAYKLGCTGAAEIVQRYLDDKSFDFHGMIAEMAHIERDDAKTLALGSLYGMQAKKAQASVGLSEREAREAYDNYFAAAPYFRELADIASVQAAKRGWVKTFCGRRRRFKDPMDYHKALNSVVQGTSADMVKQAMVNIWQELELVPLLTCHDELCYSVSDEDTAMQIQTLMEDALKLTVPMSIDVKLGATW